MNERIPLAVPISLEFKDGKSIGTFEILLPERQEGWSLNSMRDWIRELIRPMFPLQPSAGVLGPIKIPWEIAEEAYGVYCREIGGNNQSLERIAQRGGFSWGEMDWLLPGWRQRADPLLRYKEEIKVLDSQNLKLRCAIDSEPELPDQMPDEIWEKVKNDREALTELLRITVRKTKEGIYNRARSK